MTYGDDITCIFTLKHVVPLWHDSLGLLITSSHTFLLFLSGLMANCKCQKITFKLHEQNWVHSGLYDLFM